MKQRGAAAKAKGRRFTFLSETLAELKKVTWLTRREWAYLTGLVLIIIIIVGLILGVIDFGFTRLVNDIFLGG
jgi:preprotein translocase subunit SecE